MLSRKKCVLVALLCGFTSTVGAQITPPAEYAKYVGRSDTVDAFTDFGDQVNLRDGKLVFRTTDIELPGTGPTIRLTRTFDPDGLGGYFHETSGNGFGAWELEIPRIRTITSNTLGARIYSPIGWQVVGATTAQKNARCSRFSAPDRISFAHDAARGWEAYEWWNGYHLVDDSGDSQPLMSRAVTTVKSDLKLMTLGNWLVGCLAATSNGQPGEAFYAIAPDGTKYWFDYLVYTDADTLEKPLWSNSPPLSANSVSAKSTGKVDGGATPNIIADFDQLERKYASMLVTRIEDRFGNWVVYNYISGRLSSINASDGRHVEFAFNTNGAAATVTVGSGTATKIWNYAYTKEGPSSDGVPQQLTVTRPDGSSWQYTLNWQVALSMDVGQLETSATCPFDVTEYNPYLDHTVVSPAGAVLTLRATRKRFGRSYVPKECWNAIPGYPNTGFMKYPNEWFAFAVTSRTVSGPGLATATWTYAYAPPTSSWLQNCPTPTSCASTVWTDVTSPDGSRRRSIFSNKFDETENKLLREEVYSLSNQLLRSTDYAYATVSAANWTANPYPWPVSVGNDMQTRVNSQTSGQWAPARQTIVTQQGRTFTNTVNAFDGYARPTNVTKSSAP